MKTFISFLFLLLGYEIAFSQKQGNIWYFGDHAGLNFNSGIPIALTDGATYNDNYPHSEGTSVISDTLGSVLFYTNGMKLWNRDNQVMPNGDSLLGHLSSTQAALIVPLPSSSRYYYVFTTDAFYQDQLKYGFRYSIVDICLDNGLGDVISNQKNILLLDTVAEKLTAVRHSNGIDYWILTHKFYSDAFYAYLLTSAGIVDTVITHIGSVHTEYCSNSTDSTRSALGDLKASPDGSKIACVNGQTCYSISEMFDFDKTSGVVSNVMHLNTDSLAVSLYGVSFSPDNSKLYISSQINHDRIYQYDLTAGGGDPTAVVNSKTIVADHFGGPFYMAIQLGPDGKLYIAERNENYLGVITYPNLAGISCDYVDAAVSLDGKSCSLGLPNFIDFYSYSNTTNVCHTEIETINAFSIFISPNPFNSTTQITFPSQQKISSINFFDELGREVSFTYQSSQQANKTQLTIERGNLASGMYFLSFTSNEKREVVKLMIE